MEFSKEKLQDFQMLLNIASEISDNYKELSALEENNQKASIEYENAFNSLKDKLAIEEKIRSRLTGSIQDMNQLYDFLKEFYNIKNPKQNATFVTKDTKSLIQLRILNQLLFDYLKLGIKEGNPSYASFLCMKDDFENSKIDVNEFVKYAYISSLYLLMDAFNLSYTIMDENVPSWVKYVLAFQIPSCETEAINNGFQVSSNPYLNQPLVFAMIPDKALWYAIFSINLDDFFHNSLDSLVNYSNVPVDCEEKRLTCIHYATLLRACLILSLDPDKKASEIESVIKEYEGDYNYGFLCKSLRDVLSSMEQDKMIVSMGR